jgi:N6-adenosine-specific RNA methylase IME4
MSALPFEAPSLRTRLFHTVELLKHARPFGGFRMFLADPPWREEMRSEAGEAKSPQAQYRCMTIEELIAFGQHVQYVCAEDAVCLMWTPSPLLKLGIGVLESWGFEYKSALSWAKESKNSGDLDTEDDDHKFTFGTGYIFRSAAEFMLCGTRGEPKWKREPGSRSIRNLLYAPVREHSRKPDQQYEIAEKLMAGPYLELFSRTSRPGWDHFGDQAGTFGEAA